MAEVMAVKMTLLLSSVSVVVDGGRETKLCLHCRPSHAFVLETSIVDSG